MLTVHSQPQGQRSPLSLFQILGLCAAWIPLSHALAQTGAGSYGPLDAVGLIPSQARSGLIPSAPSQASPIQLVPSNSPQPGLIPSQVITIPSSPATLTSVPTTPAPIQSIAFPLIPSAPLIGSLVPIPSAPVAPDASLTSNSSRPDTTRPPVMTSTDQGLHPIPPAATQPGDPDGHHEITEPNFSATKPCLGCSAVIEVTATGWLESPPEEQHGTSTTPILTRIPAGPSNVVVSQAQSGGNFVVGDSLTVTPGQTITVNDVPIVIQTTDGTVEVVVGTRIIPLQPPSEVTSSQRPRATYAPSQLPPVLTFGTETIVPNQETQYVLAGQTISPGGGEITIAGTTISLAPSATAVVINGVTSSLAPRFGNVWTTAAPVLTFNNHAYTANRAGYITIGPGTVLQPGGAPITVDGTTLSLDHSGTAVVIQGSTSILQPVTTVVTRTRSVSLGGSGDGNAGYTNSGAWPAPTGKSGQPTKPVSAGISLTLKYNGSDGWLGGLLILVWWGLGYLAVAL